MVAVVSQTDRMIVAGRGRGKDWGRLRIGGVWGIENWRCGMRCYNSSGLGSWT